MSTPAHHPFQIITTNNYSDTAAQTFTAQDTTGGVVLIGPCPRCNDPMEYPWVSTSYRGVVRSAGVAALPADQRIAKVICTCIAPHDGRPADEFGCGAYWNLSLQVQP